MEGFGLNLTRRPRAVAVPARQKGHPGGPTAEHRPRRQLAAEGSRLNARGILDMLCCRILMLMWSLGPVTIVFLGFCLKSVLAFGSLGLPYCFKTGGANRILLAAYSNRSLVSMWHMNGFSF